MKKICCLLLSLMGCFASHGTSPIALSEAQDSVYKVHVEVTLDTSSLHPKEPAKAEKKSNGIVFPVNRFPDLAASIIRSSDDTATIGWSGTGWVAERTSGRSYVMTAGHVCESQTSYKVSIFDWSTFTVTEAVLPIIKVEHKLIGRDNVEFSGATILLDEDLDNAFDGKDLCMLGIPGDLGVPLPIASGDPGYGTISEVIGAPTGLWGGGVAIAANLKFSGRGTVFGNKTDGLAFTGEAAPGNSGSPILYHGNVVALLNLGGSRFRELSTGVPNEIVADFIRRALHRRAK